MRPKRELQSHTVGVYVARRIHPEALKEGYLRVYKDRIDRRVLPSDSPFSPMALT